MDNRLSFAAGEQGHFLSETQARLGKSWKEIAAIIDVHPRCLRDWAREKFRISEVAARKLSKISGVRVPKAAKQVGWRKHLRAASSAGQLAIKEKYKVSSIRELVNEQHRRSQWEKWWKKIGQYQIHPILNRSKPIKKPRFSKQLAEFVGIVLGDGGISKNQIVITHHRFDDYLFGQFVRSLIYSLFTVKPSTHEHKDGLATNIIISRVQLVKYFVDVVGLKIGNKVRHQIEVPAWIKNNFEYCIACTRGLIDTDGSVFTHRYKVKGKQYAYKKLGFTNRSQPLKLFVYDVLRQAGMHPRMDGNYEIRLDSKNDMRNYFRVIGTHNPKHLKRYLQ